MPRHFKIHEVLSRKELDALEEFSREPGRTIDEIEKWLKECSDGRREGESFDVSRGAVHAWRTVFLADDRFRASSEVARTLLDAAKAGDVASLSDAAGLQLQQMVFEQLLKMQGDGVVETKDLWQASAAMKNVVQSQRHVEKLREEMRMRFDQQMETVAKKPGGVIRQEDLDAAKKVIFG